MPNFYERVSGVILGTAFGDALGATVEKLDFQQIKTRYGRIESIEVEWHKAKESPEVRLNRMRGNGIVTDDTLMTLALMNVYCSQRRHLDAFDLAEEFIKEIAFRPRYIPEFGKEALIIDRLFYPETHMFLRHTLSNCDPREGGYGNMVNCGAAMYISPVGVVNACDPERAYAEAIAFASGHQCSYGLEAAGVLAACVAAAFEENANVENIVQTALGCAKDGTRRAIADICEQAVMMRDRRFERDYVVSEFHRILLRYSPMGDDVLRKIEKVGMPSNHYTPSRLFSIEELPIALGYILLHNGCFDEAIRDGVSSGRDTDSIGVMIGSILGAMHGSSIISEKDVGILESVNKQNLLESISRFTEAAFEIISTDLKKAENRRNQLKSIC